MVIVILIALLLIVIVGGVIRRQAAAARAADMMRNLRLQILHATPGSLGVTMDPAAVVMDIGYPEAVASVVAVATGDASIYFSNGGGLLGGIGHENVKTAAIAFVAESSRHLAQLAPATDFAYPATGAVRFSVMTAEGARSAEANERDLAEGRSPLSPLYAAGQEVVSALREATPP